MPTRPGGTPASSLEGLRPQRRTAHQGEAVGLALMRPACLAWGAWRFQPVPSHGRGSSRSTSSGALDFVRCNSYYSDQHLRVPPDLRPKRTACAAS